MAGWEFWLIITGVFLILGIIKGEFIPFLTGISAVFATLTSIFIQGIIIQIAVFALALGVFVLGYKMFRTSETKIVTNAKSVIGKEAIVTVDIDPTKNVGLVDLGKEIWSAISGTYSIIPKGTKVTITNISGAKVIVKPIDVYGSIEEVA